jgi:hypothetical protein
MLQRIQTVYLFLVVLSGIAECVILFNFFNFYSHYSLADILVSNAVFQVLLVLVPILAFISIWLFRKRQMQIKFVRVVMLAILLSYAALFWVVFDSARVAMNDIVCYFPIYFNLIGLIICFLAIRAIKKDENLVKSLDRLR